MFLFLKFIKIKFTLITIAESKNLNKNIKKKIEIFIFLIIIKIIDTKFNKISNITIIIKKSLKNKKNEIIIMKNIKIQIYYIKSKLKRFIWKL